MTTKKEDQEKSVKKMKASTEKTVIEDSNEIKDSSDKSKGTKNIPNPHLARSKSKPFREDMLQIENKREKIIVPVILDLLAMRSQYFNDLFSSLRKDHNVCIVIISEIAIFPHYIYHTTHHSEKRSSAHHPRGSATRSCRTHYW